MRRAGAETVPAAAACLVLLAGCAAGLPGGLGAVAGAAPLPYTWRLPPGFPAPAVPADNPMSAARVELGRHLFYDSRLSVTGGASCASCHRQELAFTDGRARARGATGELHPRSAMTLANAAYQRTLGWDDPRLTRLELQATIPLFHRAPVELGLTGRGEEIFARLWADPRYRRLFAAAFPGEGGPLALEHALAALAAFERTLISGDSPFDRWLYRGEPLPPAARRGMALFFSPRLGCAGCHRGFTFSGPVVYEGSKPSSPAFFNTGLYDLDGAGAYPPDNPGLARHTGRPEDMGRFRVPTLRNIAVTAPYMHDGGLPTLTAVIDHYAAGGRAPSPLKDPSLTGFSLTPEEKRELLAFLASLTDEAFLTNPRFADPFPSRP